MPQPRLPELSTICVLMLTAMIAASVAIVGPIPIPYKVLKDFQPLIAAVVALLGAFFVFFGAKMAYRASMAKVDLDREIHQRDHRRRQRGVLLRARFDAFAMNQSAIEIRKLTEREIPYSLIVSELELRGRNGIDEAWSKLEDFPGNISRAFSALKVELLNFDFTKAELGTNGTVNIASDSKEALSAKDLKDHMIAIEGICQIIFEKLELEISDK